MSYTPGPWAVREYDTFIITSDGDHYPIAEIDHEVKEAPANARLIASAPEMAELLKICADEAMHAYHDDQCDVDAPFRARALLSHIKGEA